MMIETERLLIRYIQAKDLDDMFEYLSDEEVMRYERQTFTKESIAKSIQDFLPYNNFYAAVLKDSGKMIGQVFVGKNNPERFNEYNVGYIFNPKYHSKGYCTEATKALCKYAFEELNAHRLTAKCNPENVASWRVMEKVGFKREGLLKSRVVMRDDSDGNPIFTDELVYGMLREYIL